MVMEDIKDYNKTNSAVNFLWVLQVQVIPWVVADSDFVWNHSRRLEPVKTVFVGALHGMLNAEGLAKIMNDLFDGVVHAGIDTDKHRYPIGEQTLSNFWNGSLM